MWFLQNDLLFISTFYYIPPTGFLISLDPNFVKITLVTNVYSDFNFCWTCLHTLQCKIPLNYLKIPVEP